MPSNTPSRIRCNAVGYRQGFIEVTPDIHGRCVNVETWAIAAGIRLNGVEWLDNPALSDGDVIGNCELELTIEQARELATALMNAVRASSE